MGVRTPSPVCVRVSSFQVSVRLNQDLKVSGVSEGDNVLGFTRGNNALHSYQVVSVPQIAYTRLTPWWYIPHQVTVMITWFKIA